MRREQPAVNDHARVGDIEGPGCPRSAANAQPQTRVLGRTAAVLRQRGDPAARVLELRRWELALDCELDIELLHPARTLLLGHGRR